MQWQAVAGLVRCVCLPTHGHTAGHQSLRVRLDQPQVVAEIEIAGVVTVPRRGVGRDRNEGVAADMVEVEMRLSLCSATTKRAAPRSTSTHEREATYGGAVLP
jgi:glyoxylase-like metal-dependent hydrolase (beta-lactamase superfamily II)